MDVKTRRPDIPQTRRRIVPDKPTPRFPRPVLVVPGGTSRKDGLPYTLRYLTHGGNNSYGGSVRADQVDTFERSYSEHGGNVFAVEYTRDFGSLQDNAAELKSAIEAVRKATGAVEIDVIAECKGSLEMRTYLQQGHDGVRNLINIAPPNRGMAVLGDAAYLVAKAKNTFDLPVDKVGDIPLDSPDVVEALGAFRSDIGIAGLRWNRELSDLNEPEGLAVEQSALHSNSVIAGAGHSHFGLLFEGDAMVTRDSALRPDAQNFLFEGPRATHPRLHSHPQALEKMVELLVNDGKAAPTEVSPGLLKSAAQSAVRVVRDLLPLGGLV